MIAAARGGRCWEVAAADERATSCSSGGGAAIVPSSAGAGRAGDVETLLTQARRVPTLAVPPPPAAAAAFIPFASASVCAAWTTDTPCGEPITCVPSSETISRYSPEHDAVSVMR